MNLDTHSSSAAVRSRASPAGGRSCWHSYAGLVITAVADRDPARTSALVHLDTDIVGDGQSLRDVTTDANRQSFLHGIGEDGLGIAPLPFSDARARPHPLATFVQKSRLTGAWRDVPVKRYTAALDTPGGSQAPATMDAVREDPLAVQGVSHHPRRPAPWTRASLTLLVDL